MKLTPFEKWMINQYSERKLICDKKNTEVISREESGVGIFVNFSSETFEGAEGGPACLELSHPDLKYGASAMLWVDVCGGILDLEVVTHGSEPWPNSGFENFSVEEAPQEAPNPKETPDGHFWHNGKVPNTHC